MSESASLSGPALDGRSSEWILDKDEFIIGREPPSDLIVRLPRISRQHARVTRQGRAYFIADLGSRNGTFVNGRPVSAEGCRLNHGDEIVLGGTMTLSFTDPGETLEGAQIGRLRGIWLDEAARDVWVDARRLEPALSGAQFSLLALLYRHSGQVITRAQIIAAVWPEAAPAGVSEEAIDGIIKRLRARLRETQPEHEYLEVLRGQGLRLIQPEG